MLDTFAETFTSIYEIYDPLFANFIITSGLEFIGVSCVETQIETFTPVHTPAHFPWFLRSRTGAAICFRLIMFPKSGNHDFLACLRAMPDMEYSVAVTNDFFSYVFPSRVSVWQIVMKGVRFYKKLVGNETNTYVHHRAHLEGKTPLQTFSEIKNEVILAGENMLDILTRFSNEATVKAWQQWEYGYACIISFQCTDR